MSEGNSSTIMRNLVMLRMIPRYPQQTTTDLLRTNLSDQGFDTSLRTIQRDLQKYSLIFPLINTKIPDSREQAWSWMEDAQLFDMPEMSPMTAMTFHLVEDFLAKLLPSVALKSLKPNFERANALLKQVDHRSWTRLGDKIFMVPTGQKLIPAPIKGEILDGVYQALLKETTCEILYQAKGKPKAKTYQINPLGMVFRQAAVYMICTFEGYADVRHIALHRVKTATPKETVRELPKGFDLESYMAANFFSYPVSDQEIKVKLKFYPQAAAHLDETPLSEDQIFTEHKTYTILEATVQDTHALRRWILGFGDHVEVLGPAQLRQEFAEKAQKMNKAYLATSE